MSTTESSAGPPRRRLRWYQFRPRAVLVLVLVSLCAIACSWLALSALWPVCKHARESGPRAAEKYEYDGKLGPKPSEKEIDDAVQRYALSPRIGEKDARTVCEFAIRLAGKDKDRLTYVGCDRSGNEVWVGQFLRAA